MFKIPFGLKIFRVISFFYNYKQTAIYRKVYIKNQAYKILNKLNQTKKKNILLVFDCKISPGTIGDFIRFTMIGRFFLSMNFNVTMVIIIGEYRESWNRHDGKRGINKHLNVIKQIAKQLLTKKTKVEMMNFLKFEKSKYFNNKNYFILFPERVKHRIQIYRESFNLLNYFVYFSNKKKIDNILLNKKILSKNFNCKKLPKKYVTLHCRRERKKKYYDRNLKRHEFERVIKLIKNNFIGFKIIIISDKYGCKFFKKISKKNKYDCLFSKDFSNKVLGDGYIILNSSFHFQLFGGGMDAFPLYSKIPCLVNQKRKNNEIYLSNIKASFWQTKNQTIMVDESSKRFFNKLEKINLDYLNV